MKTKTLIRRTGLLLGLATAILLVFCWTQGTLAWRGTPMSPPPGSLPSSITILPQDPPVEGLDSSLPLSPLTPTLGNYPDRSLLLGGGTMISPDSAPVNCTSINVSTSTSFKGGLEGDPVSGAVRVTNANPAGTYTVTVRAFDAGGAETTRTFTLTVTTPSTCGQIGFTTPPHPIVGVYGGYGESIAVGDFNGDIYQD